MNLDIKRGITFHHHHVSFAMIIAILLIVLLIFLIRPAFRGYKLNKEFEGLGTDAASFLRELDEFKSRILIINTSLENCQETNKEYLQQINDEKNATFSCLEEKRRSESEFRFNISQLMSENEQKKSTAELELNQLKLQYESLKGMYDSAISNAANNICCKNKIDNPKIDSYALSDGKIVCTIGGEKKISC